MRLKETVDEISSDPQFKERRVRFKPVSLSGQYRRVSWKLLQEKSRLELFSFKLENESQV